MVVIHNHFVGRNDVNFSETDRNGFEEFVPYVLDSIPNQPYGALVVTKNLLIEGQMWDSERKNSPITLVKIVGENYHKLATTSGKEIYGNEEPTKNFIPGRFWHLGNLATRIFAIPNLVL